MNDQSNLLWVGSICGNREAVQNEQEIGDVEPCVHCVHPNCIAEVKPYSPPGQVDDVIPKTVIPMDVVSALEAKGYRLEKIWLRGGHWRRSLDMNPLFVKIEQFTLFHVLKYSVRMRYTHFDAPRSYQHVEMHTDVPAAAADVLEVVARYEAAVVRAMSATKEPA